MKKLVAALSVALLGAGTGAGHLWRQMGELRDRIASLQAQVQAMEDRKPAVASLQVQAAASSAATVPAGAAPPPVAAEAKPVQQPSVMTRTMLRATLTQMYPDLDQELGLQPDELDKFLDLLASQRLGGSVGPDKSKADEQAIAAMLGNRYPQWQDYQQTLPGRVQVSQLRGQLAASGSALSNAQAQPLMAALNAEQKRITEESLKNPQPRTTSPQELLERELQRATENNHRMVEAATPYLNAQQLDSYRQMLERQVELSRGMIRSISMMQEQAGKRN